MTASPLGYGNRIGYAWCARHADSVPGVAEPFAITADSPADLLDRTCDVCGTRIGGTPERPVRLRPAVGPCGCACTHGGFCGGCGHAGCGGRAPTR